jgi:hypothetical protein
MSIIIILPGLVAAYIAFKRSPARAFLDVYLPSLFLMPDYYRWVVPGLPDPGFSQAAVVSVTVAFFWNSKGRLWHWSLTDALVLGFAAAIAFSEYSNAGYKEAQNLMFDMLTAVVLPYILVKGLARQIDGFGVALAQRIALLLFIVSVISLYEFRMGTSLIGNFFVPFFPGQPLGWVTTFRWGFARIAGPYSHAILAGLIMAVGFRLQRWLEWNQTWESKFSIWPSHPLSKARILSLGILCGSIMTMCRGPWIGALLAAGVVTIGRRSNRRNAVILAAVAAIVIGIPLAIETWSYASVGRAQAVSDAQETVAYRKELLDHYIDVALDKAWIGWGRNTWPQHPGMPSIDNFYLLLSLMHGLPALFFLWGIFILMQARLFWRGMQEKPGGLPGSSLNFTLMSIYVAYGFTLFTVYMGKQTVPLFFLITGWADAHLAGASTDGEAVSPDSTSPARSRFRRIMS